MRANIIVPLIVAGVAVAVWLLAPKLDNVLNPCALGNYTDGVCECPAPFSGVHCEIIECGYGREITSVWEVDLITTLSEAGAVYGCACENQFWGVNCDQCTSAYPEDCTGVCLDDYYGASCDILCKGGSLQDAQVVVHEGLNGDARWHVPLQGVCDREGVVVCLRDTDDLYFTGEHCEFKCPACENRGVCAYDDAGSFCECPSGYAGDLCEFTCPFLCSGVGICRMGDVPTCECTEGFTGVGCEHECCVRGARTPLGSVHGSCPFDGGCDCDAGWSGAECDCNAAVSCGGRGVCGDGCECFERYNGTRCDRCSSSYVGSECQILRKDCSGNGMFVQVNRRGDYGCVCDPGFEGVDCELCEADAYPKPTGFNQAQMCLNIVPPSMCLHGEIKSDFDALNRPEMDLCDCEANFTTDSMCTDCVSDHYGPNCDILCQEACFESGGFCALNGCQCPETLQLDFERQECVVCVEGGCENGGTCSNGRCRCPPGYYGDRCDVSAPRHEGRVCNDQGDVVLHARLLEKYVPCLSDADCSDKTHANEATRQVAVFGERNGWDLFCYLTDTPQSLREVDGCCVDSDGVCLASNISATFSECADLGGDYVLDICNMRVLEGEVNVYDWCVSTQRNCTKNGTCSDPAFCEGYDPTPVDWASRWNAEHFVSMSTLMSEPMRFPVPFADPYAYRRLYENVTLEEVCGTLDVYSECRAILLEGELAWNATLGRSMPVANFRSCPQPERLRFSVNGRRNLTVTRQVWDRVHVEGNAVAQAYLSGTTQRYMGTIGAEIDSVVVIGRGDVELVLYEYVSDACESLQLRASNFAQCRTLEIVELDYDWGDLCAWRRNMSAVDGLFDDHKYRQSTGCVGCEEYQEGCIGLPVNLTSPLPAPCADPEEGWENFCTGFLNAEDVVGTCARLECDCDRSSMGIGGEACDLTCPVPEGIPEPSACGADQGWGRCVRTNTAAIGMTIGECSCFKTHMNPVEGCVASCNATGQCSEDVDTPMSVQLPSCDFDHLESVDVPAGAIASTDTGDRAFSVMYSDGTLSNGTSNFTGVSLVDVTCNVLLPDSVCSVMRGRCVCAPPFTALTSAGLQHFNPNGDFRVALMQGTDMVEYIPFLTFAPPMVVDVRFSGFSYKEVADRHWFESPTCGECAESPVCYNTDTSVDMYGETCAAYTAEDCGKWDEKTPFLRVTSGTCASHGYVDLGPAFCSTGMQFFNVPYSGAYDSLTNNGCVIGRQSGSLFRFDIPHEYAFAASALGTCPLTASPSDVGSYVVIYAHTCEWHGYSTLTEQQCAEADAELDQTLYDNNRALYPNVEGPSGCTQDGWVAPRQRTVDHCVGCVCWDHGQKPLSKFGGCAYAVTTGTCESHGYRTIKSMMGCRQVMEQMHANNEVANPYLGVTGGVQGCSHNWGYFYFNPNPSDSVCSWTRQCLCESCDEPARFTPNCDLFYGIQNPDLCEQAGAPCVGISGEVEHYFEGRCGVQLTEQQCAQAAFELGYDPLEYVLKHEDVLCAGSEIKSASDVLSCMNACREHDLFQMRDGVCHCVMGACSGESSPGMAPYYEIVRSKTCATPYGAVSCGGPVQVSSGPSCSMSTGAGAQLQYNPNTEAGDGLCGRLRDYKGDMCMFTPDPNYVECSESDVEDCAIAEAETGLPCASLCHRWTNVVYTLLDPRGGSCTVVDIRPRCEEAALRFGVSFSVISDVSVASGCVYLSSGVVWNAVGVSCAGFTCVCMQRVPLDVDTPATTFVESTIVPETSQEVTETNQQPTRMYVAEKIADSRCFMVSDIPYHLRDNPYTPSASTLEECRGACIAMLDCDSFSWGVSGCRLSNYGCGEVNSDTQGIFKEIADGKCVGTPYALTYSFFQVGYCAEACVSSVGVIGDFTSSGEVVSAGVRALKLGDKLVFYWYYFGAIFMVAFDTDLNAIEYGFALASNVPDILQFTEADYNNNNIFYIYDTAPCDGTNVCVENIRNYDCNYFSVNVATNECMLAEQCTYKELYNEAATYEDASGWKRYVKTGEASVGDTVYKVDRRVQTTPSHMAVGLAEGYEYAAEKVADGICHNGWAVLVYEGSDNTGPQVANCLARCVGGTVDTGGSYSWSAFNAKVTEGFAGISGFFLNSDGRCYCSFSEVSSGCSSISSAYATYATYNIVAQTSLTPNAPVFEGPKFKTHVGFAPVMNPDCFLREPLAEYCPSPAYSRTYYSKSNYVPSGTLSLGYTVTHYTSDAQCAASCLSRENAESVRVYAEAYECCVQMSSIECVQYDTCYTEGYASDEQVDFPSNFWDLYEPQSFVVGADGSCTCLAFDSSHCADHGGGEPLNGRSQYVLHRCPVQDMTEEECLDYSTYEGKITDGIHGMVSSPVAPSFSVINDVDKPRGCFVELEHASDIIWYTRVRWNPTGTGKCTVIRCAFNEPFDVTKNIAQCGSSVPYGEVWEGTVCIVKNDAATEITSIVSPFAAVDVTYTATTREYTTYQETELSEVPAYEFVHVGECSQNGVWEMQKPDADTLVDCAQACFNQYITSSGKAVFGFIFNKNFHNGDCWCEANPSHPHPDCGGTGGAYDRYDYTYPFEYAHDGECTENTGWEVEKPDANTLKDCAAACRGVTLPNGPTLGFIFQVNTQNCRCEANPSHPHDDCGSPASFSYRRYDFLTPRLTYELQEWYPKYDVCKQVAQTPYMYQKESCPAPSDCDKASEIVLGFNVTADCTYENGTRIPVDIAFDIEAGDGTDYIINHEADPSFSACSGDMLKLSKTFDGHPFVMMSGDLSWQQMMDQLRIPGLAEVCEVDAVPEIVEVTSGTCEAHGHLTIQDADVCASARAQFGSAEGRIVPGCSRSGFLAPNDGYVVDECISCLCVRNTFPIPSGQAPDTDYVTVTSGTCESYGAFTVLASEDCPHSGEGPPGCTASGYGRLYGSHADAYVGNCEVWLNASECALAATELGLTYDPAEGDACVVTRDGVVTRSDVSEGGCDSKCVCGTLEPPSCTVPCMCKRMPRTVGTVQLSEAAPESLFVSDEQRILDAGMRQADLDFISDGMFSFNGTHALTASHIWKVNFSADVPSVPLELNLTFEGDIVVSMTDRVRVWNGTELLLKHDTALMVSAVGDVPLTISEDTFKIWKEGFDRNVYRAGAVTTMAVGGPFSDQRVVYAIGNDVLGETLLQGHTDSVLCVDVDDFVVSGSADNTLRVWDDGLKITYTHDAPVIVVSTYNSLIAYAVGSRVSIRTVDKPSLITLEDHTDDVTELQFAVGGGFLFTSSKDKSIQLYQRKSELEATNDLGTITSCAGVFCVVGEKVVNTLNMEEKVSMSGIVKISPDSATFVRKAVKYELRSMSSGDLIGELDYPYSYAKMEYFGDTLYVLGYPWMYHYSVTTAALLRSYRVDEGVDKQFFPEQVKEYTQVSGYCDRVFLPYKRRFVGNCADDYSNVFKPGGVFGTFAEKKQQCGDFCAIQTLVGVPAKGFVVSPPHNRVSVSQFFPAGEGCWCEFNDAATCSQNNDEWFERYDFNDAPQVLPLEECSRECFDLFGGFASMESGECSCSRQPPCTADAGVVTHVPTTSTNAAVHFAVVEQKVLIAAPFVEYLYTDTPPGGDEGVTPVYKHWYYHSNRIRVFSDGALQTTLATISKHAGGSVYDDIPMGRINALERFKNGFLLSTGMETPESITFNTVDSNWYPVDDETFYRSECSLTYWVLSAGTFSLNEIVKDDNRGFYDLSVDVSLSVKQYGGGFYFLDDSFVEVYSEPGVVTDDVIIIGESMVRNGYVWEYVWTNLELNTIMAAPVVGFLLQHDLVAAGDSLYYMGNDPAIPAVQNLGAQITCITEVGSEYLVVGTETRVLIRRKGSDDFWIDESAHAVAVLGDTVLFANSDVHIWGRMLTPTEYAHPGVTSLSGLASGGSDGLRIWQLDGTYTLKSQPAVVALDSYEDKIVTLDAGATVRVWGDDVEYEYPLAGTPVGSLVAFDGEFIYYDNMRHTRRYAKVADISATMVSGGSYVQDGAVHPVGWSPCTVTALYDGAELVVGCSDGSVFVHGISSYATGVAVTSVTYQEAAISGHSDGSVRGKYELEPEVPGAITELAWTSEGLVTRSSSVRLWEPERCNGTCPRRVRVEYVPCVDGDTPIRTAYHCARAGTCDMCFRYVALEEPSAPTLLPWYPYYRMCMVVDPSLTYFEDTGSTDLVLEEGVYTYACTIHEFMMGKINVSTCKETWHLCEKQPDECSEDNACVCRLEESGCDDSTQPLDEAQCDEVGGTFTVAYELHESGKGCTPQAETTPLVTVQQCAEFCKEYPFFNMLGSDCRCASACDTVVETSSLTSYRIVSATCDKCLPQIVSFSSEEECCVCGGGRQGGEAVGFYREDDQCACFEEEEAEESQTVQRFDFVDRNAAFSYAGRGMCEDAMYVFVNEPTMEDQMSVCAGTCAAVDVTSFAFNMTHCFCTQTCDSDDYVDRYLFRDTFADRYGIKLMELEIAWGNRDQHLRCYKDVQHRKEVPCSHVRALKFFAQGTSYRLGGESQCHELAPGTTDQVPCSGNGFMKNSKCTCDFAEDLNLEVNGLRVAYQEPERSETPYRGIACDQFCPGYDMQTMGSVCSGHGMCQDDNRCDCEESYVGYKCHIQCEVNPGTRTCSSHGTCEEMQVEYLEEDIYEIKDALEDAVCGEEKGYLSRDKLVRINNTVHYMLKDEYRRYAVREGNFFTETKRNKRCIALTSLPLNPDEDVVELCKGECRDFNGFNVKLLDGTCECFNECVDEESAGWRVYERREGNVLDLVEAREVRSVDHYVYGDYYRMPYGSSEPHMPCEDYVLSTRERHTMPLVDLRHVPIKLRCAVLPNYVVICGVCKCVETSQAGHWTGYNCRTPAEGYYGARATKKCLGMGDDGPCNGRGTCNWGSLLGLGTQVEAQTQCFCGKVEDVTFDDVVRNNDGEAMVHVMSGASPLYVKTLKYATHDCSAEGFEEVTTRETCYEAAAYLGKQWQEETLFSNTNGCVQVGDHVHVSTEKRSSTVEIGRDCMQTLPFATKTYTFGSTCEVPITDPLECMQAANTIFPEFAMEDIVALLMPNCDLTKEQCQRAADYLDLGDLFEDNTKPLGCTYDGELHFSTAPNEGSGQRVCFSQYVYRLERIEDDAFAGGCFMEDGAFRFNTGGGGTCGDGCFCKNDILNKRQNIPLQGVSPSLACAEHCEYDSNRILADVDINLDSVEESEIITEACVDFEAFDDTHVPYAAESTLECVYRCVQFGVNNQGDYMPAAVSIFIREARTAGFYDDPSANFGLGGDRYYEEESRTSCWCHEHATQEACTTAGKSWLPLGESDMPPGRETIYAADVVVVKQTTMPVIDATVQCVCYDKDVCGPPKVYERFSGVCLRFLTRDECNDIFVENYEGVTTPYYSMLGGSAAGLNEEDYKYIYTEFDNDGYMHGCMRGFNFLLGFNSYESNIACGTGNVNKTACICDAETLLVHTMYAPAPSYQFVDMDVTCEGRTEKVFDAATGNPNQGLGLANEAGICAEACRDAVGFWMKRTVGSPEDGDCYCLFDDPGTTCYPDSTLYDSYRLVTTQSVCRSSDLREQVPGNFNRNDCSCTRGFAGDLCLDPRMTCILGGVENYDGESCDCVSSLFNDTGGCCPFGTVYNLDKYLSFTPFQDTVPIRDETYFKGSLLDICRPHSGITQNMSAADEDRSRSVFNYATNAGEIKVLGVADDCDATAPRVDYLYDYVQITNRPCVHAGYETAHKHIYTGSSITPAVSKEDMVRYCFEACMEKEYEGGDPIHGFMLYVGTQSNAEYNKVECKCVTELIVNTPTCMQQAPWVTEFRPEFYHTTRPELYQIISAPMGCLNVEGEGFTKVNNVGRSHIHTYDAKPRLGVKGSIFAPQHAGTTPLHVLPKVPIHACDDKTAMDQVECAIRECHALGYARMTETQYITVKQAWVGTGGVQCSFYDHSGYDNDPATAKKNEETWKADYPGSECSDRIVEIYAPRRFELVSSHTCEHHGFRSIVSESLCQEASSSFGSFAGIVEDDSKPPFCVFTSSVKLNDPSTVIECSSQSQCVCLVSDNPGYPSPFFGEMECLRGCTEGVDVAAAADFFSYRTAKYFAYTVDTGRCRCYDFVPDQIITDSFVFAHNGECELNADMQIYMESGNDSVEDCAAGCRGQYISGIQVKGFVWKRGACFCEINPSHPSPECNGDSTAFPDDHSRYNFNYADSNCNSETDPDTGNVQYFKIDHFSLHENEDLMSYDLETSVPTLSHSFTSLNNSDYVEITFEEEVTPQRCSKFCAEEKVRMDNYFTESSGTCINPITSLHECKLAFESTGVTNVTVVEDANAPKGCSTKGRQVFFNSAGGECENDYSCLCRATSSAQYIMAPEKSRDPAVNMAVHMSGGKHLRCAEGREETGAISYSLCEQACLEKDCSYFSFSIDAECQLTFEDCSPTDLADEETEMTYSFSGTGGTIYFNTKQNVKRVVLGNTRKPWKHERVTITRYYEGKWTMCQQVDASDINQLQPLKSYPCEGPTDEILIECPQDPEGCHFTNYRVVVGAAWQTYKNERAIRVVGTPGALTHMEVKGTTCKCHSGGDFIPDDDARLFTVPTGDTVPTWDKSLFYRRNEKNPFVCNTESLSDYRLDGDSCSCNTSNVALREMRTFRTKSTEKRTRTFDGTSSTEKTYEQKLQECARSCRDKTNIDSIQSDVSKQWIQDHTMNVMEMMENGRCYCYDIDNNEFVETTQWTLDNYRAFQIVPGCACDGKFMQGGHAKNCPVGSYNLDACRTKCTMCPMGYFQASAGASHCRICPKGFFQDKIGQPACRTCRNTCPNDGDKGTGVDKECTEGSIEDDTDCSACVGTHAQQPGVTYISLAYGSFGVKEVMYARPTKCTECTDGKYIDGTGCTDCPEGWISTAEVSSSCTKCPAGYYQGSSGMSSCKLCSSGKYQTEEAKLLCKNCPVGFASEALFPNSMNIMHEQAVGKECLPCGSVYGKSWSALSADVPAADYSSKTPPAPGCVFCNQYQDELGQRTCKACDQTKVSGSNGKWLPYSYKDSTENANTIGACKYVENMYYYHERSRATKPEEELDFCNSDMVYSSETKKRQLTEWKTCIYQKGSSTYTRGTSDFKIMPFTAWITGLSISSPSYKIQGYRKPDGCSPATIDYYIKDKGESCPSSGVYKGFLQQQYKSYRTSAYVFKVEEEQGGDEEGLSDYDVATIVVSVVCPLCGLAMWAFRI